MSKLLFIDLLHNKNLYLEKVLIKSAIEILVWLGVPFKIEFGTLFCLI